MANEQYRFPDEAPQVDVELDNEDSFSIEIEDDTPAEDRNREPMPKEIVDDLEKDDFESYDDQTKQKVKQLKKVWNDERRDKEAAHRERQEAVNLAQRLIEENKNIRALLQSGEKSFVESVTSTAELEVEKAKRMYMEAYDTGDSALIADATSNMQNANIKLHQAKNFKLPALQERESSVQTQQQYQPVPQTDRRAENWRENNSWFGQDEEMTAAALGLHEKLKRNGITVGSDEYYATLDKTMRKRFAENFDEPEEKPAEQSRTKPSTVVAPALRSTSPNKIKLRQSQVQLAKKLGLTPEQYAQAALKLENSNGR